MKKLLVLIAFTALAGSLFLACQRDSNPVGTALSEGTQLSGAGNKATVWHIPGDFGTIQEAIDDEGVSPGDVILVSPGEHYGATVTKAVEIKGQDGAVINSGPQAVGSYMVGLYFPGEGAGSGAKISHLRFETVELAVYSRGADEVTVEHCTIINSLQGVSNWHGTRWAISYNDILDLHTNCGGGIGILVASRNGTVSNDNVISHNKITGTLHVTEGDCGTYNGCGIAVCADFRYSYTGAVAITGNRLVNNKISLVSDNPGPPGADPIPPGCVPVTAIELSELVDEGEPWPDPHVVFGNLVSFNDLRGTLDKIKLSPEDLGALNDISGNLGEDKGKGKGKEGTKIKDGELEGSDGSLLVLGYDEFGYNYQAHMFNGRYCDYDRVEGGDDCDVELIMKWNDAWLSNMDRDGDGLLDRHYGYDSYIGSGAWETNHMRGEDDEGNVWTYFVKIVAVPSNATLVGGVWYNAEGGEIGPVIWGAFAIIQELETGSGPPLIYKSPVGPGFGKYKAE